MKNRGGGGGPVRGAERMVSWAARRYGKFLVAGALSACLVLNLALHAGAGLFMYCQEECLAHLVEAPLRSLDKSAILHIRNHWVDPPAPKGTYQPNFPLDNPPWSSMGSWGEAYKFINNYFKQYKSPGVFMEVGAGDGEFMSLTLDLEVSRGFQGVLLEPNPVDYEKLRALGRSAASVRACATPEGGHRKDQLWLRQTPSNLPPLLRRMQEGSNRLMQYVSTEDRDLGETVDVQCFNGGSVALAALGTNRVDLLTISTHGGEMDVLRSIPSAVQFRVIVITVPLATKDERTELADEAEERGLTQVFDNGNIHILIPKGEVKLV